MARIDAFFKLMAEQKLRTFIFPLGIRRCSGSMATLCASIFRPLANDDLKAMVYEIAPEGKIKVFEETLDVDFGYEVPGTRVTARISFNRSPEFPPFSADSSKCYRRRPGSAAGS